MAEYFAVLQPTYLQAALKGHCAWLSLVAAPQFNSVQNLLQNETQREYDALQEISEAAREQSTVGVSGVRASLAYAQTHTQLELLSAWSLTPVCRRLNTRQSRAGCRTCRPC